MISTLLTAKICFVLAFIAAPPVDIDRIREPITGSLLHGNIIITAPVVPTTNAIGLHFYPIWKAISHEEWLYNGGPYQLTIFHFLVGIFCWMGREWELSCRLDMSPWIAVAYSAPMAAAIAVLLVYAIGQGSFSDAMPRGISGTFNIHAGAAGGAQRADASFSHAWRRRCARRGLVLSDARFPRHQLAGEGDHRNGIPQPWLLRPADLQVRLLQQQPQPALLPCRLARGGNLIRCIWW